MGWAIDPRGLSEVLLRAAAERRGPELVVTENGAAFADVPEPDGRVHDPQRMAYLRDHIAAVHDAIAAGAPVTGY